MRVRPFFWFLLALSCAGTLIFAATFHTHTPGVLHIHIEQPLASTGFTTLELHLTDLQGRPIEEAQIAPSARMTNMNMTTNDVRVVRLGDGYYVTQLALHMAGPWMITLVVHADGFDVLQQTLPVEVR